MIPEVCEDLIFIMAGEVVLFIALALQCCDQRENKFCKGFYIHTYE